MDSFVRVIVTYVLIDNYLKNLLKLCTIKRLKQLLHIIIDHSFLTAAVIL